MATQHRKASTAKVPDFGALIAEFRDSGPQIIPDQYEQIEALGDLAKVFTSIRDKAAGGQP